MATSFVIVKGGPLSLRELKNAGIGRTLRNQWRANRRTGQKGDQKDSQRAQRQRLATKNALGDWEILPTWGRFQKPCEMGQVAQHKRRVLKLKLSISQKGTATGWTERD